jgi:hypothetical protein
MNIGEPLPPDSGRVRIQMAARQAVVRSRAAVAARFHDGMGPVTWLFVIVVVLVLGAGFAAALGLLGGLPENEQDLRPDTRDGEPAFDVVVRGYRMDEVDAQLESMRTELDELHQELERTRGDDST